MNSSASCPITPHSCTWSKQALYQAVHWYHPTAVRAAVAACGTVMDTAVCHAHGQTLPPQSYTALSQTSSHSTEHIGTAIQSLSAPPMGDKKPGALQEDLEINEAEGKEGGGKKEDKYLCKKRGRRKRKRCTEKKYLFSVLLLYINYRTLPAQWVTSVHIFCVNTEGVFSLLHVLSLDLNLFCIFYTIFAILFHLKHLFESQSISLVLRGQYVI